MAKIVSVFSIILLYLVLPRFSAAYQIAGGVHDLWPDYESYNVSGSCNECHRIHQAVEPKQWVRDLTPDAVNASDLCLDCHDGSPPAWAASARDMSKAENSFHDFPGSVAPGGVCSSCHSLHYPDEGTAAFAGSSLGNYFTGYALWNRDLTNDLDEYDQKRDLATDSAFGDPNYLVGMTALCYDCHGGPARQDEPDDIDFSAPAPQDIAFAGDRGDPAVADGSNVGYYELPTGREPGTTYSAPSMADVRDSYEVLDNIPGGHYVKTWMEDGATDDNYEVRDPGTNLLYKISIGDKLPCEMCHDPHLKKPGTWVASDPSDEVFFRRRIFVGEGTVIDRTSETFFREELKASDQTRNGTGGASDGRKMCIYCHGTSDWDENQSYSDGVSPIIVNWTDKTTVYGIKLRYPKSTADPKAQKMSTAFPPPDVDAHKKDPGNPGELDDPACQTCHLHNNTMSANCAACHSYGNALPGAHNKHVAAGMSCDVCHGVGADLGQHADHSFAAIPVVADEITLLGTSTYEGDTGASRPSWFGSTWGGPGISGDTEVTYTTLNDFACVNVRCHGLENDASVAWNELADSPTYNNICFECHNTTVSSFQLPGASGTLYQATNAAANYIGPISGFSRGGHGDTAINDAAWFKDSAPGSTVPLACVACHDESQGHFPVETGNPYRVSDNALNNNLPGDSSAEGPLTNLCTQTNCHPKVLGAGDYGFLSAIKHPSDHWPTTGPVEINMLKNSSAQLLDPGSSSTADPALDPDGRTVQVDLHIDRYVDHWGYWGASATCTATTDDDEPFLPLDDSLEKLVGQNFNNDAADLITCVTCHNPHGTDLFVSGEGCQVASTLTSIPDNRMLRLRNQDGELCNACH